MIKEKSPRKHDFGKKIIDFVEICWFVVFIFVAFITLYLRDTSPLNSFIYVSGGVWTAVFAFSIWKAKSDRKLELSIENNIPIKKIEDIIPEEPNSFYGGFGDNGYDMGASSMVSTNGAEGASG